MQTGIISFCNRSAVNIKSESTKRFLLNKLENAYHTKIIKRHFDVVADEQSLSKIRTNPHIACLKSNGNPYFMFLTKIDDINTCVMIDKKIQYGYFLPRMIIVRMRFEEDLFSDTLIEGEMVLDTMKRWIFLANDLVAVRGNHLSKTNVIKRVNQLHRLVAHNFEPHDDLFSIQVKKYVACSEIDDLVANFAPTLPYTNRGILFKPMFSKFKDFVYNFESVVIKSTVRVKYGEENKFICQDDVSRDFIIRNTDTPDTYELYNTHGAGEYVGRALVNTMASSKMLHTMFATARLNDSFTVKCKYNTNFKKWEPCLSPSSSP